MNPDANSLPESELQAQFALLFPEGFAGRPLQDALDRKDEPDWAGYDPTAALAKEEEDRKHDHELAELRESFDQGYQDAVEESRSHPPPATVRDYEIVYGRFPRGWPPEA